MSAWGRDESRKQEITVEGAIGARREQDKEGRLAPSPVWLDLGPEAREEIYRLQLMTRMIERAVAGVSGTVLAVMARIEGM